MSGMGSDYTFRLARAEDAPAIICFMNIHWEIRHPLVNLPDFFDFYYKAPDGKLNFVIAEQDGKMVAIAGFVPSSIKIKPDIWVSLWVADKTATGSGLELMAEIPKLTGCRVMACNNIRPETRMFYEFLGYKTGRVNHFYRLARRDEYHVATVKHFDSLPAGGSAALAPYASAEELAASGFIPPEHAVPYKDLWYIERRYFHYPRQEYLVYGLFLPEERRPSALLAARVIPVNGTTVLRIVDFIGDVQLVAEAGTAIDQLMEFYGAEYADWYCAGVPAGIMREAGFSERTERDENIIPNYLSPPVYDNTDFYYFTSDPARFTLFKADGDQDRPNIQA